MTLLMAAWAIDGVAAVSDRKESPPNREVTKYHMGGNGGFYISLAGDGRAASGLLRRVAEDKTVQAADIEEKIRDFVASLHDLGQSYADVDGILIMYGSQPYKMYDLYINDGCVQLNPNYDAISMHGDYAAIAICRSLTAGLDTRRMRSGEAAAILHMLASKAAATVDSVGGRKEYGFDLAIFGVSGRTKLLKRCTDKLGTVEVLFHVGQAVGQVGTGRGEGGQAHG